MFVWEFLLVHYGLNNIKLAFDAQCKIVILTLITYLLSGLGFGIENAGLEPITATKPVTHGQCDARPTVTFPDAERHRPLAGTELCCFLTEEHVWTTWIELLKVKSKVRLYYSVL